MFKIRAQFGPGIIEPLEFKEDAGAYPTIAGFAHDEGHEHCLRFRFTRCRHSIEAN